MTAAREDLDAIDVVLHYRAPGVGVSIEGLFDAIRDRLPSDIVTCVRVAPKKTAGALAILQNVCHAMAVRSRIHHITGDIHYITVALPHRRTILTIHDCVTLTRVRGVKRWLVWLIWYRIPTWRASVITVISEKTHRELCAILSLPAEKVRVIPNCVSEQFTFSPRQFDANEPRILQVGTAPNKNVERVVEALSGVRCHLRIIGRLSDRTLGALRRSAVSYSSASGLTREQLVEEYRNADLLVFASTYEGFGLPPLEAQATGRPVVTSRREPMRSVVGDGGALLVDPLDVGEIRRAVLRIVEEPELRAELVRRGHENVAHYTAKAVADQYAALYRELAGAEAVH